MSADEVANMANSDESDRTCPKCGKAFKYPSFMRAHQPGCKAKGEAPARSTRPKRNGSHETPAAAPTSMAMIPVVKEVPERLRGTVLEPALQLLLEDKKSLEAQLARVSDAIQTVSRLQPVGAESRPT